MVERSVGNHSVPPAGSPRARCTRWGGERWSSAVFFRRALPARCPWSCRTLSDPSFNGVPWWWHLSTARASRLPYKYERRYRVFSGAGRDHRWGWSLTAQRRLLPVRQRFHSPRSGWRLSAPASWAEPLAACFRATGQGLLRCSGQVSATWRWRKCRPRNLSFADEFNILQNYTVLIFDVHRAVGSLPFQVHHLSMPCKSRPGRLLECVFRVCGRSPRRRSARQSCEPSGDFSSHLHGLLIVDVVGFCAVGASTPPLFVAMLHSSQPPQRAPRTNFVLRAGA